MPASYGCLWIESEALNARRSLLAANDDTVSQYRFAGHGHHCMLSQLLGVVAIGKAAQNQTIAFIVQAELPQAAT